MVEGIRSPRVWEGPCAGSDSWSLCDLIPKAFNVLVFLGVDTSPSISASVVAWPFPRMSVSCLFYSSKVTCHIRLGPTLTILT